MRRETIGDAVLYLGDCREILPTLGRVDACVTDPPYGVDLGNHHGASECRKGLLRKVGGYLDTVEYFDDTVPPVIEACLGRVNRAAVFGVPPNIWKLPAPSTIGGIFIPGAVGRNKWGWSNLIHCLLYGTAPGLNLGAKRTAISSGDIAPITGHPTTKPTSWMKWAVDLASHDDETVLDPFMGSGTTGIACVNLGRKFIGIEIEPKYFDIACRRIEEATRQPRLFTEPAPKAKQAELL